MTDEVFSIAFLLQNLRQTTIVMNGTSPDSLAMEDTSILLIVDFDPENFQIVGAKVYMTIGT